MPLQKVFTKISVVSIEFSLLLIAFLLRFELISFVIIARANARPPAL